MAPLRIGGFINGIFKIVNFMPIIFILTLMALFGIFNTKELKLHLNKQKFASIIKDIELKYKSSLSSLRLCHTAFDIVLLTSCMKS